MNLHLYKIITLIFVIALFPLCAFSSGESDGKVKDVNKTRSVCLRTIKKIRSDLKQLATKYPQLSDIGQTKITGGGDDKNLSRIIVRFQYEHNVTWVPTPPLAQAAKDPEFGQNGIIVEVMFSNVPVLMGTVKKFDLTEIHKDLYAKVEISPDEISEELRTAIVSVVEKRVVEMLKRSKSGSDDDDDRDDKDDDKKSGK